MQLIALKHELSKPRWGMDLVVSLAAATGFYIYIKWLTRMFETNPFDPGLMLTYMLIIGCGYISSFLIGRIVLREGKSSIVWITGVGSAIIGITMILLALPGRIEHHNRFFPNSSLAHDLITDLAPGFLWITLSLTVVTLIPTICARVVWLLLAPSDRSREDFP